MRRIIPFLLSLCFTSCAGLFGHGPSESNPGAPGGECKADCPIALNLYTYLSGPNACNAYYVTVFALTESEHGHDS